MEEAELFVAVVGAVAIGTSAPLVGATTIPPIRTAVLGSDVSPRRRHSMFYFLCSGGVKGGGTPPLVSTSGEGNLCGMN